MARTRLTRLELQILELLWARGNASIREIQEAFPAPRPAYTTVQTTVYRLEAKQAVRRVRKISNAHIFEPIVARDVARLRLIDEVLSFFGGRAQPMMAQLVEAGKLTRDDLRALEQAIEDQEQQEQQEQQERHARQEQRGHHEQRGREERSDRRAGSRRKAGRSRT
jgi:BlaI family penicillinase repressor